MKKMIINGAAVASLIFSFVMPAAFAAKDNTNFLNGKPFSYMNDAIEANQASIQALQVSVSALNSSVEDIIGDIAALELRVANNSNDIRVLFANDTIMGAELDALRVQHEQDVAAINAGIAQVNGRVAVLRAEMESAMAEAKAEVAALQAMHDADVSSLLTEITTLLVQIADIRNNLDAHSAELSQLTADAQQLNEQLAGLQLRVEVLTGRVDALEGYHMPLPQQCDQGNDAHTNSPWVVCEADANEAWISANNSGTYHPEEICQKLGYRTVGRWGGTCGNVCGYCQASTSCSTHGTKNLYNTWDGRGNAGQDEFGGMIRYTVSWSCVM